ncbi:MAG TPA: lysophospholipid acyltransferase family protein [Oscillospiraceae bacterium]|nr:lysophospholipid acyltransferase family protein [Oscillospiraceae bacterium]
MKLTFLKKVVWVLFRFLFWIEYEGLENLPEGGGYLVCPNHRSYFDPLFIGDQLPLERTKFMVKAELLRGPLFSGFLKKLGCFGVDRGKGDLAAVETAVTLVREGNILMIFPEGTRGQGPEMKPFKTGAAFVAKHTGAGIVPVAIDFKGKLRIFKKVTVRFGTFIPNGELGNSLHKASNLIRERVDAMLEAAKWS